MEILILWQSVSALVRAEPGQVIGLIGRSTAPMPMETAASDGLGRDKDNCTSTARWARLVLIP